MPKRSKKIEYLLWFYDKSATHRQPATDKCIEMHQPVLDRGNRESHRLFHLTNGTNPRDISDSVCRRLPSATVVTMVCRRARPRAQ